MGWKKAAAAGAAVLAVVLQAGCAGPAEDPPAPTPTPTQSPQQPVATETALDPAALPSLRPLLPPVQTVGFAINGEDGLRSALQAAVEKAGGESRLVEVHPIASSGELVGFRIRSSTRNGIPISSDTLWYALNPQRVVASSDLLVPGAAAPGGVSFTPSGEVYLESVQDGATVRQVVDPSQLSVLGTLAQQAALTPTDPAPPAAVDCKVSRCIALTFDDGPSDYTPGLLRALAANNARATFYIKGNSVPGRESTLQAMSVAGHQIGNHSQNHLVLPDHDGATIAQEIAQTKAELAGFPANGSATFRPPYGRYDDRVIAAAADAGYSVVMWGIDPVDYRTTDPATVADRVLGSARAGAVVLSHDSLAHTETAYRTIIPALRQAGYELVTVDQLLGAGSPGQVRRGG